MRARMVPGPVRNVYWQAQSALEKLALFRQRVTSAGVGALVRDRLARREHNFLSSVEHLIFANPHSPYRPLLDLAGYDLPKLKQLVLLRGVDVVLDQLREDGVYIRVREFKGMEAAVRRGRTFRFQPKDFENPWARGVVRTQSSGSRSRGTQTDVSVENLLDDARLRRWVLERYGLWDRDFVLWSTYLTGFKRTVQYTVMGRPPQRWFCYADQGDWATTLLIKAARLLIGLSVPQPELIPSDRVLDVARYISWANTPRGILVTAFVNPALRLMLAAEEAGIRLGNVAFVVGGEPLTPLKRRQFEQRGFSVYSLFSSSESGPIAWACPVPQESDDLHVLTDRLALRQYQRTVDRDGATVAAYMLTSILPDARYVMVNMESGDYGGLEVRRCGCFLDSLGYHLHVFAIRSFEKLTAEGITFIGPDLITLLEEVLPREFGGDSRHYQLVEGEDSQGFTKLYVLASPRLGEVDHEALRQTVLREIGRRHLSQGTGPYVQRIWDGANTIQVLRREPLATATGKILHLHRDRGALRGCDGNRSDGASPS